MKKSIRYHIIRRSCIALVFFVALAFSMQTAHAQFNRNSQNVPSGPTVGTPQTTGVLAEKDNVLSPEVYSELQAALNSKLTVREPSVFPNQLETLLFTFWQHALLQEAKQRFNTGDPNQFDPFGESRPTDFPREVALGGISYRSAGNWTVWLNGKRVTPEAIPQEIIDIRVNDDFVELKWYDGATQIIYPVRLRPHERFNLDTRLFITGTPPSN